MNHVEALELVKSKVNDDKLVKHMLAVESCMKSLAKHLGEDEEKWGLAGILHDIDYEKTKNNPEEHGLEGAIFLKEFDIPEDILNAIKVHAGHGEPETKMDMALLASDALSGLIVASALVHPGGLRGIDVDFVMRKFKEKQFARGADREIIKSQCEKMNLELEEFVSVCLSGMQKIADVLAL